MGESEVASIMLPTWADVFGFDQCLCLEFLSFSIFPRLHLSLSLTLGSQDRGKILSLIRVLVARGELIAERSG